MTKSMESNTAAIYLRKSTEDDGKSVAQQERDIRARAGQLGIDVIAVYREDDGTSASSVTNHNRPQFERCLADFKAGEFDTIMVWDMDRWTRKGATEAGQLLDLLSKHSGRLVDMSMDTLATGLENARIPLLMKAEIARTETVNMQKRVLRAKEQHRREGKHLGGSPPYGLVAVRSFDAPTYLVVDPEAAANLKMMAEWIIEGCSTTEVAHKLNDLGLTTSRNAAWTKLTVSRLMRSPHLIGQRLYRNIDPTTKKVISQDVARDENGEPLIVTEPILDEATFARVDAILSERKRASRQKHGHLGTPRTHLLAGLTRCSKCRATCGRVGGVNGGYYKCKGCRLTNSTKAEAIEDYVSFYALSKPTVITGRPKPDPVITGRPRPSQGDPITQGATPWRPRLSTQTTLQPSTTATLLSCCHN